MAESAKSISSTNLSALTKAAVKSVNVSGKFVGTGPIMGFIADSSLTAEEQLELATSVTQELSAKSKASGLTGLKAKPVVVRRPGTIIAGFLTSELPLKIR